MGCSTVQTSFTWQGKSSCWWLREFITFDANFLFSDNPSTFPSHSASVSKVQARRKTPVKIITSLVTASVHPKTLQPSSPYGNAKRHLFLVSFPRTGPWLTPPCQRLGRWSTEKSPSAENWHRHRRQAPAYRAESVMANYIYSNCPTVMGLHSRG